MRLSIGVCVLGAASMAWAQMTAPSTADSVQGKAADPAPDGGLSSAHAPGKPPLNLTLMPFTPESIRKVVAYHQEEIQACYEETLADKDKPIEGRLNTAFIITAEGAVKKPRVIGKGTTLKDPKLHACVVNALSTFTFPKPHDRREHPIEYPFNLKAIR